MEGTSREN